jgi:hypothetical protein
MGVVVGDQEGGGRVFACGRDDQVDSITAAPRSESRALVGSSITSTDVAFIRERAMFTRCRCPRQLCSECPRVLPVQRLTRGSLDGTD